MFSGRTLFRSSTNRWTRLLDEKRRRGDTLLDLTQSNPTRAGFDYPAKEILGALADPGTLNYDPHPLGALEARRAVADFYAARHRKVHEDSLVLTAGTSEAYSYLFKLLADPGDNVLVPQPSYPLFEYLARLEGVRIRPYLLEYRGVWEIDLESVTRALTPRSRALLLVNPNNPTGSYVKAGEWEKLEELCGRRDLAVVLDEVFFEYPLEAGSSPFDPVPDSKVLTFVLGGLSKLAGLPQLKLGWIGVHGPHRQQVEALGRLEIVADTFLSVGSPAQNAARRLMDTRGRLQTQIVERLRWNLELLRELLTGSPARILRVEGGWYAVLELPRTRSEEEWALELLDRHGVLVHPGYFYDFPREAFLVVSLLSRPEDFREGIAHLLAVLD